MTTERDFDRLQAEMLNMSDRERERMEQQYRGWVAKGEPVPDDDPDFEADVEREIRRLQIRDTARLRVAGATFTEPPSTFDLAEELAIVEPPLRYVVEGWQLEGQNTTLTAEFKAGKTTTAGHITKTLADDEPFLETFDARRRRVGFWNYELSDKQFRAWLRALNIRHPERVHIQHLRGWRVPLTTPAGEGWAVGWLQERGVTYWILDTFARAMADCGLKENENHDIDLFTSALDVIKRRAGVRELLLTAHTGREAQEEGREHARGGTRLDDWADVRWVQTQQDGGRYLRAIGRDIEQPETQLVYDHRDRSLSLGEGSRAQVRLEEDARKVGEIVRASEEILNKTRLRAALGGKHDRADAAIYEAERLGEIRRTDGPGNATLFYPVDADRREK